MEVKEALEADKIEIEMADIIMMADNMVNVDDEAVAAKIIKLIDLLEDHDDVQNVYSNANISDEIMEKL